eukprot:COSAG02_NODE_922_length_15907_cov_4.423303_7_plen_97_part_00
MVRCRLIVLILLVCAVADGRVSNIVCGDCDASPAGCSKGCPVEPIEEELTESIVGAMATQVPPIEVAIEEPPIEEPPIDRGEGLGPRVDTLERGVT